MFLPHQPVVGRLLVDPMEKVVEGRPLWLHCKIGADHGACQQAAEYAHGQAGHKIDVHDVLLKHDGARHYAYR